MDIYINSSSNVTMTYWKLPVRTRGLFPHCDGHGRGAHTGAVMRRRTAILNDIQDVIKTRWEVADRIDYYYAVVSKTSADKDRARNNIKQEKLKLRAEYPNEPSVTVRLEPKEIHGNLRISQMISRMPDDDGSVD